MAAIETFRSYLQSLTDAERAAIDRLIHNEQTDLFAARSEEARVRIVQRCIACARKSVKGEKG